MKTAVDTLELARPKNIAQALRLLRDETPLVPIAGCTDVFVALNFGTHPPARFMDLWAISGLRKIEMKNGVLSIGALATYTSIIKSRLVSKRVPMLVEAAREIGGIQIQNRGTIGGNIANASPAGDTLPVLAAVDAVIVLRNLTEERRIPITQFYTGYRASVRRPDELIVAVEIGPVEGTQWFRKVGTRAAQAISKVVMAGVRSSTPRIALGSVAPTVVRLAQTESVLASGGSIEDARKALEAEIHPIDDVRSTAEYRLMVASNLLARFWADTAP